MSTTETPLQLTADVLSAPGTAPRHDHDMVVEAPRSIEVPPAFYRDDDLPPPPPDDPHWREWPHSYDREPVSRLVLIGLPVAMGVLGVFHILAILLVVHFSGLY